MQPEQYALMRAEEEAHWWYRGNREVVQRLVAQALPQGAGRRLDAGCGTGKNLEALAAYGTAHGIDTAPEALALCAARGAARLARASVCELPFAAASFDLVTCFEVLYHEQVVDWRASIAGFARVLRPGGVLVLREPAFPFLRGSHDVVVRGARRFRCRELRLAVEAAGLAVLRCSYQNMITFWPALVIRTLQRWRGLTTRETHAADFRSGRSLLNGVLARALAVEGAWLRHARLPFGSSVICVARKLSSSG